MIKYICLAEFEKDFKALQKCFRTLTEDFETFKKFSIETFYEINVPSTAFFSIEGFCRKKYKANKVRNFACKSLPGRSNKSGIRIIFVWHEETRTVIFVEIYFKGDKPEEDRNRLKTFIESLEKKDE